MTHKRSGSIEFGKKRNNYSYNSQLNEKKNEGKKKT